MQACTWKEQRMAPSWYKSDEISSRDKAQKILFDADGAYTLQWDEFPLTYTIIPKTQQLSEKHWGVWGVSGGKLTQQQSWAAAQDTQDRLSRAVFAQPEEGREAETCCCQLSIPGYTECREDIICMKKNYH